MTLVVLTAYQPPSPLGRCMHGPCSYCTMFDGLTLYICSIEGSRPSSQSPSPRQRKPSPSAKRDAAYVVSAGRLISKALTSEQDGDYDEAFDLLKAGVDVLLNGVQST